MRLQEALARLYYDYAKVVIALDDVGVDRREIDLLAPTMLGVWRSALEVSLRQGRVGALAYVTARDYPGRTDLAPLLDAFTPPASSGPTSGPNPWCAARARLRDALCIALPISETHLPLAVARATALDPSHLDLGHSPRFCWHTLLLEAELNGNLDRVVAEVRREVSAMKARRAAEEGTRRGVWVTWMGRAWRWFTTITRRLPGHLLSHTERAPGPDDVRAPPWTDPTPELDGAWEALLRADAAAAPPLGRRVLPIPALDDALSGLRDAVASRFVRPSEARIVAVYADLDLRRVDLSGTSERCWTHLLIEAKRAGKLRALIDAALRQHPEARDVAEAGQSIKETPADPERSVPDETGAEVVDGLDPGLLRARELLASCYPDSLSAMRVPFCAGIEARVNNVGSPNDVWMRVLSEAAREQQLPALFRYVREDCPGNQALREFIEIYLEAHDLVAPPARS